MTEWENGVLWCGYIAIVIIIGAMLFTAFDEFDGEFIETEYKISSIDLQTLVYVNDDSEIVTIDWSDKTSQTEIINSNSTYIVAKTKNRFVLHTLYLNVSDLE